MIIIYKNEDMDNGFWCFKNMKHLKKSLGKLKSVVIKSDKEMGFEVPEKITIEIEKDAVVMREENGELYGSFPMEITRFGI